MLNKYYVSGGDLLVLKSEENMMYGGVLYTFDSYYKEGMSVIIPCRLGTLKFINNLEDAIELLKKSKDAK